MIMIQENRAQKGCFAKSQTPQDVFWNPIIGQFLYGTVYEEDDLILTKWYILADSSDDTYFQFE